MGRRQAPLWQLLRLSASTATPPDVAAAAYLEIGDVNLLSFGSARLALHHANLVSFLCLGCVEQIFDSFVVDLQEAGLQ